MKKIAFPIIVVLLVASIAALVGYNSLVIQNRGQEVLSQQPTTETNEPTTNTTDPNAPVIYCIGDSLTMNTDVRSYASYLKDLTGLETVTIGGMEDTTMDMAIRTGAVPVYVDDMTIPSEREAVEVTLYDENHEELDVLHNEGSNFREVSINNVSGILTYDSTNEVHTFTRSQSGEEVNITEPTQVMSEFPQFKENDIVVLFSGTYDPNVYMGIFDTINGQYRILNAVGNERYIVVSLTSRRTFNIVNDMNQVLEENFNEHYLDFRSYLMENGLTDAGIEATEQDQADLSNRYIPSSLLQRDLVDGNEQFNELLANQLLLKLQELGYIEVSTEDE